MADHVNIIYRVNDQDDLVFVSREWDRFAADNSGDLVTSQRVLNRPLWDFITDENTRELYRQVLKRVREGSLVRFTFRCDSPNFPCSPG